MKHCTLLLLPGLSADTLRDSMPWLRARPWRPLRLAFPALPATLQATLETGQPPSAHGVFGSTHLRDGSAVVPRQDWRRRWDPAELSPALIRVRDDRFSEECDLRERAAALDDELRSAVHGDRDGAWLVVGGPARSEAARQHEPSRFAPEGSSFRAEGRLLFVDADLDDEQRSRALLAAGIERILHGESRARRGCDHAEAGRSILIASRGWSFGRAGEACFGAEPDDGRVGPFLAACGALESAAGGWPNAVHDLRVAPTVAAYLGDSTERFAEKPLGSVRA